MWYKLLKVHEADSLYSQRSRELESEAEGRGIFYGMKNKEQEVRIEPRTALVFGDWLTRYAVKQSIHRDTNII